MSSVEAGDWMVANANPTAFLEVVEVHVEEGTEQVKVRVGNTEQQVSKRYLLACWQHLEDSADGRGREDLEHGGPGHFEGSFADGPLLKIGGEQRPGDGSADEGVEGTVGEARDGGHAVSMRPDQCRVEVEDAFRVEVENG